MDVSGPAQSFPGIDKFDWDMVSKHRDDVPLIRSGDHSFDRVSIPRKPIDPPPDFFGLKRVRPAVYGSLDGICTGIPLKIDALAGHDGSSTLQRLSPRVRP
jgi:hypothetical protein